MELKMKKLKGQAIVDECRSLSHKAGLVIDSASLEQKQVVERYLCLYNRYMRHYINQCKSVSDPFGLVGMSMGIKRRFETKFGNFHIQIHPIYAIHKTTLHKQI
jgi:hypothetical protein